MFMSQLHLQKSGKCPHSLYEYIARWILFWISIVMAFTACNLSSKIGLKMRVFFQVKFS